MDEQQIKKIVRKEMALYEASNSPIQQGIETYMRNKQFNLSKIPAHEHNGVDTVYISAVNLPAGTPVLLGLGGLVSISNTATAMPGTAGELIQTSLISGKDVNGAVIGTQTNNLQFNLIHYPQSALNQSFVTAMRPPIFEQIPTSAISITAGGNTVTITDYSFIVNSLAGALINIYDPTDSTKFETQTIASNTNNVITIIGSWINTYTNSKKYLIFQPVYLGGADTPWQRLYVCDGIGGGIRFGQGPTNGGQNVLLYTDSTTGALMVRDLAGNSSPVGGGGSVFGGNVTSAGAAGTLFPSGWSVAHTGTGFYTITHNLGTTSYAVVTSALDNASAISGIRSINTNTFVITTLDSTFNPADTAFHFLLTK